MWLKSINTFFENLIKQFSSFQNDCLCLEKINFMIAFIAATAYLIPHSKYDILLFESLIIVISYKLMGFQVIRKH